MEQGSTTSEVADTGLFAGDAWFDPIEAGIRERVRGFIQELLEQELTAALGRGKSERASGEPKGYRNGTRERQLLGSFGPIEIDARPYRDYIVVATTSGSCLRPDCSGRRCGRQRGRRRTAKPTRPTIAVSMIGSVPGSGTWV
jgi:hypothetical protein